MVDVKIHNGMNLAEIVGVGVGLNMFAVIIQQNTKFAEGAPCAEGKAGTSFRRGLVYITGSHFQNSCYHKMMSHFPK